MAKTSKASKPPAKAKSATKAAEKVPSPSKALANPVGWFEIYVENMARARKFYESVFQVTLNKLAGPTVKDAPETEMWAFPMAMDRYGAPGALVKMGGFPPGRNSVLVYFTCEDCAVEAKRAKDAGGRIMNEKMSIGEYGHIALAFDSEGNMIGLHSMQ